MGGWLYIIFNISLKITLVLSKPNDTLIPLEIPKVHSTQEIYRAFKNEPRAHNLEENEGEIVISAAASISDYKPIFQSCTPDLSSSCPEGWEKKGDTCEAPMSYKGDCSRSMSFEYFTMEGKLDWASSCGAPWPCKLSHNKVISMCENHRRNYNQHCPELFMKHVSDAEGLHLCVPDYSRYSGPCNSVVDFSGFSTESKILWAESCGTNWPCLSTCPSVFEECPDNWMEAEDGSCHAPPSYTGPCDRKVFFTYFTQKMKMNYLLNCDIPFECSSNCEKDYSKCPVLWMDSGAGICRPPDGIEPCYDVYLNLIQQSDSEEKHYGSGMDFGKMSTETKVFFESRCASVSWPCTSNDGINWSHPCPMGWTQPKSGDEKCAPPHLCESDFCRIATKFDGEEEKRRWASQCRTTWPKHNVENVESIIESHKIGIDTSTESGPVNSTNGDIHHGRTKRDVEQGIGGEGVPKLPEDANVNQMDNIRKQLNSSLELVEYSPEVGIGEVTSPRRAPKGFTPDMHLMPGS